MNSLLLVALAWGTASVLAAAAFANLMRHRRRDTPPNPGIATPSNAAADSSPTVQPDFTGRASVDGATDLLPEQRCREARRLATAVPPRVYIPQPRAGGGGVAVSRPRGNCFPPSE